MPLADYMPPDSSTAHVNIEEENGFSDSLLTFAAVVTFTIMIVGILGNFLTVVALLRCPKVRNVAAAFIISLGVADLVFCALVLPFNGMRFLQGTWTHGDVLCKLIPFIQYGNVGVSLLCIAMITINRYVMIAHHNSYAKIYKKHWIAVMVIFCWSFSYGMQLPTLLGAWGKFDYDPKLGTCSIMPDIHGNSSKTSLFIIAFIIPCIIIIACYAKIFWVVHQSETRLKKHANKQNSIPNNLRVPPALSSGTATGGEMVNPMTQNENAVGDFVSSSGTSYSTTTAAEMKKREATASGVCIVTDKQPTRVKDQREVRAKRNEWRITKMVLAIFLSFVVCYLPITIVKIADKDVLYPGLHVFSYIMLYLSACVNPIIYVIMNKQYRKAYKTVIMCEPSRLLSFGKNDGGGGNGGGAARGSSIPEKWKDAGLSNNHSRTMVSQMSDPQNTSISGSQSRPVSLEMTVTPPSKSSIMNTSTSTNNNSSIHINPTTINGNNDLEFSNNSKSYNNLNPNRITVVGEDIILEEEEEPTPTSTSTATAMVIATPTPTSMSTGTTAVETTSPVLASFKQHPLQKTALDGPIAAARAEPKERIYVNMGAELVPKKNPYYGQNINATPDNGIKLNTKLKI